MCSKNIKRLKGVGMRIKGFSVLLLTLIFISSLAIVGCGGGGGQPTPTPTPTPVVTPTPSGGNESYWEVDYNIVTGSYLVLNYSAAGITPVKKTMPADTSDGCHLTLWVSKTEVDGTREVILKAAEWVYPEFTVESIMTGIDMDLILGVDHDTVGTLYVEDGIGDVDMSSESTAGADPIQVDTFGDGTMDAAGSMLMMIPLVGIFDTSVG